MRRLVFMLALLSAVAMAAAQEPGKEDNSFFVRLIEDQLSSESRQIRLNGIDGLLSSEASIAEITIADRDGVWLRIENAKVDWRRLQLLKKRLVVNQLTAERIVFTRLPVAGAKGLPSPEAKPFRLPELPVSVRLAKVEVGSLEIDSAVYGVDSRVRATGALTMEDGEMDGSLLVSDLTGAGGRMSLNTSFSNETGYLDVDLALNEAENGILSNLLKLESRPPVALRLKGAGPVENLDLALSLDIGMKRAIDGFARLRGADGGLRFDLGVTAALKDYVPESIAGFFGDESRLSASGATKPEGGIRVDEFSLSSAALSFDGALELTGDGFLERLEITSRLGIDGAPTVLPVGGGDLKVSSAVLNLNYVPGRSETWGGTLEMIEFSAPDMAAREVKLDFSGIVRGLNDPANRVVTFAVEGAADGIESRRPEFNEALGSRVSVSAQGAWNTGGPVVIQASRISGRSLDVRAEGDIRNYGFDGILKIQSASIAPFSRLVKRNLAGGLDITVVGSFEPLSGAFDLTVGGLADDLRLDIPQLDPLLVGQTALQGQVARSEAGLATDGFLLDNDQIEITSSGMLTSTSADMEITAVLTDLGLVTDRATGPLRLEGTANGDGGTTALNVRLSVPFGTLLGKPLVAAELTFDGSIGDGRLIGGLNGVANLESFLVELSTQIAADDSEKLLEDLEFRTEGVVLTGDLRESSDGLIEGEILLDASDISTAAALLLQEATGAARGMIELSKTGGRQEIKVEFALDDLQVGEIILNEGRLNAQVRDAFGVPKVSGTASAKAAVIAGVSVADFSARAANQGATTVFRANAMLDNGTEVNTQGTLGEIDGGYRLDLNALNLKQGDLIAGLAYPSVISVSNGEISIETLALQAGDGQIRASGVVSDTFGLAITFDEVPLSLANAVRPDLGIDGTVSGSGAMYGARGTPNVFLDLTGTGVRANVLNTVGMAAFGFNALITSDAGKGLDLNLKLSSSDGVSAKATGNLPFDGSDMAFEVELERFPLSVFEAQTGNRGLAGTIAGIANIGGTPSRPTVKFDISADGFELREVRMAGLAPLRGNLKGEYFGNSLEIEVGHLNGPQGLSVDIAGFAALPSGRLDFKIDGGVPLSTIIPIFFRRGTTAEGMAIADLTLRGQITKPRLSGSVSASKAVITDPPSNMRIDDVDIAMQITDNNITINRGTGRFAGGGQIKVTGSLDIDIPAALPADLTVELSDVVYSNHSFLITRFDSELNITGPLARGPLLSGSVRLQETELSIIGDFGSESNLLEVTHRNAPGTVRATEDRLRKVNRDGAQKVAEFPVLLDLTIESANRIFVRGRGVDAELGGKIQVRGSFNDLIPEGSFELVRGRMSILSQRITLDSGEITLIGDLDPELDFSAETSRGNIVANFRLSGRVSDLELDITSVPDLPEDEIIARIIFGQNIEDLSPLQLASLASALAELAGKSQGSILGDLRQATGLDDLDLFSDQDGNTVVRAGKYIDEKVYLSIESGSKGTTRAAINIDITDRFRARGGYDSDGQSDIGVFFERDY